MAEVEGQDEPKRRKWFLGGRPKSETNATTKPGELYAMREPGELEGTAVLGELESNAMSEPQELDSRPVNPGPRHSLEARGSDAHISN
jgi:hypothetical protein